MGAVGRKPLCLWVPHSAQAEAGAQLPYCVVLVSSGGLGFISIIGKASPAAGVALWIMASSCTIGRVPIQGPCNAALGQQLGIN